MNVLVDFNKFIEHLTSTGHFIRKSSLDDTHILYEFFSPLLLPSSASIWRVSVGYITVENTGKKVDRVHQEFLEFCCQSNVTRLIVFSDSPFDDGLQHFLNDLGVELIDLTSEIEKGSSFENLYPKLEDLLYPVITPEEIIQISSVDKPPDAEADVATEEFLYNALLRIANEHRKALSLLYYYITIPRRSDTSPITKKISHDFGGSYFASVEHDNESSSVIIYPNRFYIQREVHNSGLLIAQLNAMQTPDDLRVVKNALLTAFSAMIHLYLNILYGIDLHETMTNMSTSSRALSHETCMSLLLKDCEARPPDEQVSIIDAAVRLNGPSDIVVRALIKGAESSVKSVALHCINLLGIFRVKKALPLLRELKSDGPKRIRDAAEQVLTVLESSNNSWKSKIEWISIDNLKRTTKVEEADREVITKVYKKAACDSYFLGPAGTIIHIRLWDADSDSCIATTTHEDGTQDVAMGKRFGMLTHIVGSLTGAIQPSPNHVVGMGEAVIMDADGNVLKRIDLSGARESNDEV